MKIRFDATKSPLKELLINPGQEFQENLLNLKQSSIELKAFRFLLVYSNISTPLKP